MTQCSVIMVTHQTGPILLASIGAVLAQKSLAELIVVDNGNPPDILTRLNQWALGDPRLKIVTGHGNLGYAKAVNLGAKHAGGYFLLLLNPDCLPPPNAIQATLAAFEADSQLVIAGSEELQPDGSLYPHRPLLTPRTAIRRLFGLSTEPTPEALSGSFICIRRKDFVRLNGLDEAYFVRGAIMDLCLRTHRMSGKTGRVPGLNVTRLNTNDASYQRTAHVHTARGIVHYFRKHYAQYYPLGFMLLVRLIVWLRFGALALLNHRNPTHSVADKRLMLLASCLAEESSDHSFEGKTILVTGATGQVGLSVIRRLLAARASVLAISRNDPIPFEHTNLRWIKGDLADNALHLQGYLVDIVVHCASLKYLPPIMPLLAAAEVKRIVAFSSTSIFTKALSHNAYERELVEQLSKAESELARLANDYNMSWTILRPTMIYGVGLDANITSLSTLIRRLGFFPIYPPAIGKRQPVHVDDLALGVLDALENSATYGKSYNVSGSEKLSYREMLERIFITCGRTARIIPTTLLPFIMDTAGKLLRKPHINGEIARRMNDDLLFFHDDAKRDFGFAPRKFVAGGMKDIEGY